MISLMGSPYIAVSVGSVSKKGKEHFAVMFPDATGFIYLVENILPEWQRKKTREESFAKAGIKPVVELDFDDRGFVAPFKLTIDAGSEKVREKAATAMLAKYDLCYLLDEGFITKDHAIAMVARALLSEKIGATEALAMSRKAYIDLRDRQEQETMLYFGTTAPKEIAAAKKADPVTLDVKSSVVTETKVKKEKVV